MSPNDTRPVLLRIRFPYGSEEEFLLQYGSNLARGGVFVATQVLKPAGTPVRFEFILADGARVLFGEARVVKVQVDEGGQRSGMTLQFTRLDASSKALIERAIAHRTRASPPKRRTTLEEMCAVSEPKDTLDDDTVLGIDLGTTYSRVAVVQNGKPTLIPLTPQGDFALPSVVALAANSQWLLGDAAFQRALEAPSDAVFGAKRILGRRARAVRVQELADRVPFSVDADASGDAGVKLRGQVYPLGEIYARLLGELKAAAWRHLGREIRQVVLCVPAYFNDRQRNAMKEAATLAGFSVLRMFSEPSAVALAFGQGQRFARKRVLVYDLGGGTFDVSVVEFTGDELEVVTTGGDNFLGGMDFDERIAKELFIRLASQGVDLEAESPLVQRVRAAAERAKIALSDQEWVSVRANEIFPGLKLELKLTRPEVENLTADLVERTLTLTSTLLSSAALAPESLDEVLLVGGQSRAPLVRRRVQEALGRPVRTHVDAHAAVALGAAVLGQAIAQARRGKRGITLSEVLSAPIGIAVAGGAMKCVLDKNTRLPAEKTLPVPVQKGDVVGIGVFQGEAAQADENEYLGCIRTTVEKSGELDLHFHVGVDGMLELSAIAPNGQKETLALAREDIPDALRAGLWPPLPTLEKPGERKSLLTGIKRLFGRG